MNILYFTNYFTHNSAGAAAICTYKITKYLSDHGHKLMILAPGGKGKTFDINTSSNFINVPNLKLNQSLSFINFPFNLVFSHFENMLRFLIKIRTKFKPDLIMSQYHTFHYASVVASYLAKILALPHIIRSHDIFIDMVPKPLPFRIFFSIIYPQIYHSIRNCNIDYVQTTEMKDHLQKIRKFRDVKFKILHNGIDLDLFYPSKNQEILKEKYGCETLISFIGLMTQDIGLYNFIKALPEVLKSHKDTHLLLIGDGPDKKNILELASKLNLTKRIHFLGIKPHADIPFFINNCDIGIGRITHKEMWRFFIPVKCLEYMACKKPFITTPISQDIIKDNDVGLIIRKNFSEDDIVNNLNYLIEDKALQKQLGERGINKIYEKFNWDIILQQFNGDLLSLVKK